MRSDDPDASSSTLVRSGMLAMTYSEMIAFVRDIENRPTEDLLADLEELLALGESKYQLVVMVLRKRTRPESAERAALLERMRGLVKSAGDDVVRSRARDFLEKPSS